jgi:hypothetical protein
MSDVILRGIDGSNPLGFLAALGTLRLLTTQNPHVRLHWRIEGVWRPILSGLPDVSEEDICELILRAPPIPIDLAIAILGKDLTVPPEVFARFAEESAASLTRDDRRAADFAAAFGSEVCQDEKKPRIQYTGFCFITGSGHQHFVETVDTLLKRVTAAHISHALFGPWRYETGLSMRWDPADAREYALRWNDPGPEGVRAVWGANRLAAEALPLFPTHPNGKELTTTGFRKRKPWNEFTWPLWGVPVSCDTVRSLVALQELQFDTPDRLALQAMGVQEILRVQRVRIGIGANFKVSFRAAYAV